MTRPFISIILPTYNEAESIAQLLSTLTTVLRQLQKPYEILVVDDNSPDGTADVVGAFGRKNPQVQLIVRTKNRGLGLSILEGIKQSLGSIVIGMDADGNHDPQDIPILVTTLKKADCVVASRFLSGGGMQQKWRMFPTLLFNYLLRFAFGFPITDNLSGFYAIKRHALFSLPLDKIYYGYGDYHLRLVYLLHKMNWRIVEVPTFYKARIAGQSKSRLVFMVFSYLREAWRVRYVQTT